ncbi:hypothetical protein [Marinicella meishanensis]|nr:hypothetical protein [Marinicella sp. NBU2979]
MSPLGQVCPEQKYSALFMRLSWILVDGDLGQLLWDIAIAEPNLFGA